MCWLIQFLVSSGLGQCVWRAIFGGLGWVCRGELCRVGLGWVKMDCRKPTTYKKIFFHGTLIYGPTHVTDFLLCQGGIQMISSRSGHGFRLRKWAMGLIPAYWTKPRTSSSLETCRWGRKFQKYKTSWGQVGPSWLTLINFTKISVICRILSCFFPKTMFVTAQDFGPMLVHAFFVLVSDQTFS